MFRKCMRQNANSRWNVRKYVKTSVVWWCLLEESNLFRRLSKIDLRQPRWRLAGPCAHHRHQQQRKRHQAFELGFFLVMHFAPIHIYNQTTLRTEAFTQGSFYAQVFLHREVCAQIFFGTQTPLRTEVFTQRRKCLHTDALYKDAFAHINKGT